MMLRQSAVWMPSRFFHRSRGLFNPPSIFTPYRLYAKKSTAHASKNPRNNAETDDVSQHDFDISKFADRMEKCVDKLKMDLSQLRLGRANTALLENVKVLMSGGSVDHSHPHHHSGAGHHHPTHHSTHTPAKQQFTKLGQLAQLIVKDPQTVHVIVADSAVAASVDKAIRGADLNLNPQIVDSNLVKVTFPKMSQEYRDTIMKQVHTMSEGTKIKIRGHRQDARTALKKRKSMPQNEARRTEKDIQDLTDKYCHNVDAVAKEKNAAIQKS